MFFVLIACLIGSKKYKIMAAAMLLLFQITILNVSFGAKARDFSPRVCSSAIVEYKEAINIYLLYLFISSTGFVVLVTSRQGGWKAVYKKRY
jgi:hypothetical protein